LDTSFGFEKHTIRGLRKMHTRCCLALVVMPAMAVGLIKSDQAQAMRSLVKPAAWRTDSTADERKVQGKVYPRASA
jgi:hypothetical protein